MRWLRRGVLAALLIGISSVLAAESGPAIQISSSTVRQGQAIAVTVQGTVPGLPLRIRFAGRVWPLYAAQNRWQTYLGTDPTTSPGRYALAVEATSAQSPLVLARRTITVVRVSFGQRRLTLDPRTQALLDPRLIALERRKVQAALSVLSPAQLWDEPFEVPVAGPVTSRYGVLSIYQGRRWGFHGGIDFAAATGTLVQAANDGIVRLAEQLPLSGNAVLIDHGLGVITSYLHLSDISVKVRQHVRRGEVVGRVGSTGLAIGSHLHWGLRTNGVSVDPMPWTNLSK